MRVVGEALKTTCELFADNEGICGSDDEVRRFLSGLRCAGHRPNVLAGHPYPDPVASQPEPSKPHQPIAYGWATTDPLGRTIPGTAKNGFIPSRPCTECSTPRPDQHKGDHL